MRKEVSNPVKYSVKDYRFPVEEVIARVEFSHTHMIVHLDDGRFLGIPLSWIPTLAGATPADREKVTIVLEGHGLLWDPDDGPINEILRLTTYLGTEKEKTRNLGRQPDNTHN
jgi:hypothetical protein